MRWSHEGEVHEHVEEGHMNNDWIVLWRTPTLVCVVREYPSSGPDPRVPSGLNNPGDPGGLMLAVCTSSGLVRTSEYYARPFTDDLLGHVLSRAEALRQRYEHSDETGLGKPALGGGL